MKNTTTENANETEIYSDKESSANTLLTALLQAKQFSSPPSSEKINGVVIGVISAIDENSQLWVSRSLLESPLKSQSLCVVTSADINRQCAIMFENGDQTRPIVLGLMQQAVLTVDAIAEQHTIGATDKIELHCGKASLTLCANGNIELRGTKIVTHSTGLNHIRGASVKLN